MFRALIKEAPVGKKVGGCLYLHRSAESTLPVDLQVLSVSRLAVAEESLTAEEFTAFCGGYNILKIHYSGRVSFLTYPLFDEDAHPSLRSAVAVPDGSSRVSVIKYKANSPVLHRKELFVEEGHPLYRKFKALTEMEELVGLLDGPPGYQAQWGEFLNERGVRVEGHSLVCIT